MRADPEAFNHAFTSSASARGFSLLETIVAAGLIATAVAALAQLVALGAQRANAGRHAITALAAAQAKVEQLRALTWTYAADATRLSDESTDLSVDPPASAGGSGLLPSPPPSLAEDVEGYVDYLDHLGINVTADAAARDAAYVRRWAVSPLEPFDDDALVLQVCVFHRNAQARDDPRAEACVTTVRVRKP